MSKECKTMANVNSHVTVKCKVFEGDLQSFQEAEEYYNWLEYTATIVVVVVVERTD